MIRHGMGADEGNDDDGDEGPASAWLPPDDRLWRHPSELADDPWPQPPQYQLIPESREPPRLWTVAVLAGCISSLLTVGLVAASGGFGRHVVPIRSIERVSAAASARTTSVSVSDASTVVAIAQRVRPSIVQIKVDGSGGQASGSGVIFRGDGHILTNNHVIAGASSIKVVMADGREVRGTLTGADEETDVAVVKIDGAALPIATLGSASLLKVGQSAIAIGSPLGLVGGPSVTVGVVSALGREVRSSSAGSLLDMIQTDAPIAPGSSGGALLDGAGDVIGITTAIAVSDVGAEGLGFATPIDIARDVADQIITSGHAVHVWLGVEGEDLDTVTAGQLKIAGGALIRKVRAGSPADKAGVIDRDVITGIEHHAVISMASIVVALRGHRPGDSIVLDVLRDGARRTMKVRLAERPKSP
jgi:S1-C subfamily serine protease